jgi:hypothetical protein
MSICGSMPPAPGIRGQPSLATAQSSGINAATGEHGTSSLRPVRSGAKQGSPDGVCMEDLQNRHLSITKGGPYRETRERLTASRSCAWESPKWAPGRRASPLYNVSGTRGNENVMRQSSERLNCAVPWGNCGETVSEQGGRALGILLGRDRLTRREAESLFHSALAISGIGTALVARDPKKGLLSAGAVGLLLWIMGRRQRQAR